MKFKNKEQFKKVFKPILRELIYEQHEVVKNLVQESLTEMIQEDGLVKEIIMEEVFNSSQFSNLIQEVTKGIVKSNKIIFESSQPQVQQQAPVQQTQQTQQMQTAPPQKTSNPKIEELQREFKQQFSQDQRQMSNSVLAEKKKRMQKAVGGADIFEGTTPMDSPARSSGGFSGGGSLAAMREQAGKGGTEAEVPEQAIAGLMGMVGDKWKAHTEKMEKDNVGHKREKRVIPKE